MALKIKEIGKARNLVGPTSAYAVRRMRTHSSISERTLLSTNALDTQGIFLENNQNKNPNCMKSAYTRVWMRTCPILCIHISRKIRVLTCS